MYQNPWENTGGGSSGSGGLDTNTTVSGFGTGQVLFVDSSGTLEADTNFVWDASNGQVLVGDGSASNPAYAFGSDVDTGMYLSAVGTLGLVAGGTGTLTLDDSGNATASGAFVAPMGSVSSPGYQFSGHATTGFYMANGSQIDVSVGGTKYAAFNSGDLLGGHVYFSKGVSVPAGSTGDVGLFFGSDSNTGLYSPGADQVSMVTGGTEMVSVATGTTITTDQVFGGSSVGRTILTITGQAHGTGGSGIQNTAFDDVTINLGRTVTFAGGGGALSSMYGINVSAPTYAASSSQTITTAATIHVDAAPSAGTNVSITNAYALYVESGDVRFGGRIFAEPGSGPSPSYGFRNDTDTGMFWSSGALQFAYAGVARMYVNSQGVNTNYTFTSYGGGTTFSAYNQWSVLRNTDGEGKGSIELSRGNSGDVSYVFSTNASASGTARRFWFGTVNTPTAGSFMSWDRNDPGNATRKLILDVDYLGNWDVTPAADTSGSPPVAFSFTAAAHTGVTDGTDLVDVTYDLSRTVTYANATQTASPKAFKILAPTYTAGGSYIAKDVTAIRNATFYIDDAPTADNSGGNTPQIGSPYAIWVDAGDVVFDDDLLVLGGATFSTTSNPSGSLGITQAAATTGTPSRLLHIVGAAHTGLSSSEWNDVYINLAQTKTLTGGGGAISDMRAVRIDAPTYAASASQTITNASTLYVSGAPTAGTNVTISSPAAIRLGGGHIRSDASSVGLYASDNTGLLVSTFGALTMQGTSGGFHYLNAASDNNGVAITARITTANQVALRLHNNSFGTDFSASSGSQIITEIKGTVNQSGTAGYSALELTVTENSTGSGGAYLIHAAVNATYVFGVENDGVIYSGNEVAMGAAAGATLGTVGGSGPSTAAQDSWLKVKTQNGTKFVPLWA